MVRIDMSEFMEKHSVARLVGAPPGYVGYEEGGYLTEAVRRKPYSVILLDEVEKAHPEVLNLFYQAFDKGELADGEGRVIDCQNIVFFLTSNLGYQTIVDHAESPEKLDEALKYTQRIWSIFQGELSNESNPLPRQLKTNLLQLSSFIDKRIFETMSYPSPDKLTAVININKNIAAGLRGSPSD